MIEKLQRNRRSETILLALVGIAVMVAYGTCSESCTYLQGSLFGVDLKYLGMLYMGLVLILGALGKDTACLVLLSVGMGGEAFLMGYQALNGIYCPFCLAFALVVVILFTIRFEKAGLRAAILFAAAGFLLFLIGFSGLVPPAYAGEIRMSPVDYRTGLKRVKIC
jgi:archaellum biogenesis protein FlaJ (TadC family)